MKNLSKFFFVAFAISMIQCRTAEDPQRDSNRPNEKGGISTMSGQNSSTIVGSPIIDGLRDPRLRIEDEIPEHEDYSHLISPEALNEIDQLRSFNKNNLSDNMDAQTANEDDLTQSVVLPTIIEQGPKLAQKKKPKKKIERTYGSIIQPYPHQDRDVRIVDILGQIFQVTTTLDQIVDTFALQQETQPANDNDQIGNSNAPIQWTQSTDNLIEDNVDPIQQIMARMEGIIERIERLQNESRTIENPDVPDLHYHLTRVEKQVAKIKDAIQEYSTTDAKPE